MFTTLLADCFAILKAELGLAGTDEPAQPAHLVVVSSERGGSVTMERAGRSNGQLVDDYRFKVFNDRTLVIGYSEMRVETLAA